MSSPDLEKLTLTTTPPLASSAEPKGLWAKLKQWGVEPLGITPVPMEEQTDIKFFKVMGFWAGMSTNLLPIASGMVGTLAFGLSLRDASLVILFFSLLCAVPPSYLATLGPKTGLRQMIQGRYSFGYYPQVIPILLNLATLVGFCVIALVIGGQTLSAVSGGSLSWNVGIVILGLLSLIVSFGGYNFVHYYERYSPIPIFICFIITTGTCGSALKLQYVPPAPATVSQVITFAGLLAGFFFPYSCIASDFGVYFSPKGSQLKIFLYAYLGLLLPTIPLLILGAAIGGAVPLNPTWNTAYNTGSIGAILAATLSSLGGFGKFVLVILSFSTLGNLTGTSYAIGLNFEAAVGVLGWKGVGVHRGVWAGVTAVIVIPVSIKAATSFFAALENFIGVIAYWSSAYTSIVLLEHFYFKQRYEHEAYDDPKLLPWGGAALLSGAGSFALVIPCMSQTWYTGPLGLKTGDLGFEVAFILSGILYIPMRTLEKKWCGR